MPKRIARQAAPTRINKSMTVAVAVTCFAMVTKGGKRVEHLLSSSVGRVIPREEIFEDRALSFKVL